MKNDVYQIVTDKVIEALEKGAAPWRKPWNARQSAPANFVTKKAYRGMNAFLPLLGQLQTGSRPWRNCQKG
jgi:antirestriction protein ArdC